MIKRVQPYPLLSNLNSTFTSCIMHTYWNCCNVLPCVFSDCFYAYGTCQTRQWRRNEINIAGARRDPKGRNSKSKGMSQGPRVLGEGLTTAPPHQLGGLWESCELPQWGPGRRPPPLDAKNFGAFWVLQVSCPIVPAMQNCVCRSLYKRII